VTGSIPPKLAAIIRSKLGLPAQESSGRPQVDQSEPSEKQKTTDPVRFVTLTGSSPLMSKSEIVRELRRLRYDPANGRGKARKVPIKRVAEEAGVHRATLYRAIMESRISDKSRLSLGYVLINLGRDDC
jgi:hypothetical protein